MRKDQIGAAAVNIEAALAEQFARHRAALDVPARPPVAHGRTATRLARLGELPQREIERIVLVLVLRDARAGPSSSTLRREARRSARNDYTR